MAEKAVRTTKESEAKQKRSNSCKQRSSYNSSGSPADRVLQLQRTAGNQAVQRLIKSRALQAKLRIGQPNDIYEQEADRVAEQVMRMPEPLFSKDTKVPKNTAHNSVQHKCLEFKLNKEKEEKFLQAKEISGSTPELTSELESNISAARGDGQPLPESTRTFFEPRFGHNFSDVKVHANKKAAESAKVMNAKAYTLGKDIVFGSGMYAPHTSFGQKLIAHELTHIIQHMRMPNPAVAPGILQRDNISSNNKIVSEAEGMSITPEYAQNLKDTELEKEINNLRSQLIGVNTLDNFLFPQIRENLNILESEASKRVYGAKKDCESARNQLIEQGPYFDPNSGLFTEYGESYERLATFNGDLPEDPNGIIIPADELLVVDDTSTVQLISDKAIVQISDDLFPVLSDIAASSKGDILNYHGGQAEQVFLWNDGRAVITDPSSYDLPNLLIKGKPTQYEGSFAVSDLSTPWKKSKEVSIEDALHSGTYLLGTYPISSFNGVKLPPGTRIRFTDPRFPLKSQTRFMTIFEPGTKRFYAWDYHPTPVGAKSPHPLWHVNQKGMYGLFGEADVSPIPAIRMPQARALRYITIGGKVFLLVGVFVDSYTLTSSVLESVEKGTPNPAIAQSLRVIGSWGGAWAGAKAGCAIGGAAGVETGPGLVLFCIGGGLIFGAAGYFGADWIADMIHPD